MVTSVVVVITMFIKMSGRSCANILILMEAALFKSRSLLKFKTLKNPHFIQKLVS